MRQLFVHQFDHKIAPPSLQQLATSDLQTEMATSPPLPGAFSSSPYPSRPASTQPGAAPPAVPSSTKPRGSVSSGMKLSSKGANAGSNKKSALDDILGDEGGIADAWGDDGGDLMDVNDDADDWGGFEEAPVPLYPTPPTLVAAPVSARTPWDDLAPPVPAQTKPSNGASSKTKVKPSASMLASLPTVSTPTPSAEPSPQVSLVGLSKEEKDKEMARRREERKARIAALKGGK